MTRKFKTSKDMFTQLEWCGYECEAGVMHMNVAYIELKEYVTAMENIILSIQNYCTNATKYGDGKLVASIVNHRIEEMLK